MSEKVANMAQRLGEESLRRVESVLTAPVGESEGYRRSFLDLEDAQAARPPLLLLEGPGDRQELVIVVRGDDPTALERRLRRLLRRLSVRGGEGVKGMRPVTVVLAGGEHLELSEELARRLCRVLALPEGLSDEQLETRLAPLLPFQLPEPVEAWRSAPVQLMAALGKLGEDRGAQELLRKATQGPDAVREAFFLQLRREGVRPPEEESEELLPPEVEGEEESS
ncbi:MAG: hypothetical protein AAGD01_20530 [Acidobacteriota bacterium]